MTEDHDKADQRKVRWLLVFVGVVILTYLTITILGGTPDSIYRPNR